MGLVVPCETTDRSVAAGDGGTQAMTHYCSPAARSTVS